MPIIATFAGGTDSMLENNKEGILVQDGDPFSMAGAIVEMKNNFDGAKQMAKNARQRALKRHDKERVVEELYGLYKSIIRSGH
jgi:glycosyltransferase involved in cell wall biosynthesis